MSYKVVTDTVNNYNSRSYFPRIMNIHVYIQCIKRYLRRIAPLVREITLTNSFLKPSFQQLSRLSPYLLKAKTCKHLPHRHIEY